MGPIMLHGATERGMRGKLGIMCKEPFDEQCPGWCDRISINEEDFPKIKIQLRTATRRNLLYRRDVLPGRAG